MYDEAVVQYFWNIRCSFLKKMLQNRRRRPKNFRGLHGSCLQKYQRSPCLFEDEGADIAGMSNADLAEAEEVFAIPDGRYLIVEA